jgi:hypothetical protein
VRLPDFINVKPVINNAVLPFKMAWNNGNNPDSTENYNALA